MLISSTKGLYQLLINVKDAYNTEIFENLYIEECFDKYTYILGDLSDSLTRLKGFSRKLNEDDVLQEVRQYLKESCVFRCPYFLVKRLNQNEFNSLLKRDSLPLITEDEQGFILEKVPFDKEGLVLETSGKRVPNIVIDSKAINQIPKGTVSKEIRDIIEQENVKEKNSQQRKNNKAFVKSDTQRNNSKQFQNKNKKKAQNNYKTT